MRKRLERSVESARELGHLELPVQRYSREIIRQPPILKGADVADKAKARLIEVASQFLQGGETIEVATYVIVGSLAGASTQGGLVGALVSSAANAGNSTKVASGKQYVVVTDRRLFFLGMNQFTGRPEAKVTAEVSRAGLATTNVKRGMFVTKMLVTPAGADRGIRLQFPLPSKADALVIAKSLTAASAV
jgi:hypothetical protein